MVNRQEILELVAHYVVILVIVTVVLAVVRNAVGDISFWVELGVIIVLVALYRPAVKTLGYEPSAWQSE
jgi:ABC-type transport system involved in cytochrome bd biosynthesis fused ATPase/permease subunit